MEVDIQAIIDRVLAERGPRPGGSGSRDRDVRDAGSPRPAPRVYDGEPILRTGRQVLAERERRLPEPYLAARRLEHEGAAKGWPDARTFAEEARALSAVTDDAPYSGPFERYYPTYKMMTDRQLRGYVTWRTRVRAGEAPPCPASFAFVYVYELLNGVGWEAPEEGFAELGRFWRAHGALVPQLGRYMRSWLADFAAYYGVDRAAVEADPAFAEEVARGRAVWALENPAGRGEDELFGALALLSGYRIESSRFYRDHPDDLRRVAVAAAGALDAYCRKNRRHGLYESLFGWQAAEPREMFSLSVFNRRRVHADCEYRIGPFVRYRCSAGRWTLASLQGGKGGGSRLGSVMKLVDARMRERYGYPHPLKDPGGAKYLVAIVDGQVDAWLEERRAREAAEVRIDLSKLGAIRASAEATCEALLVDEERGEDAAGFGAGFGAGAPEERDVRAEAQDAQGAGAVPAGEAPAQAPDAGAAPVGPAPAPPAPQVLRPAPVGPAPAPPAPQAPRPAPAPAPAGPAGLTLAELELLRRLLAGEPCQGLAAGGVSLDMLADSANEKLYPLIGDTAVEFGAGGPELVEDYRQDIEGIVRP